MSDNRNKNSDDRQADSPITTILLSLIESFQNTSRFCNVNHGNNNRHSNKDSNSNESHSSYGLVIL